MKISKRNYNIYGWLFVSAALILYILFTVYPFLESFRLSFTTFTNGEYKFVGLNNYKRMFSDALFVKSMKNTFIFLVIQVPIMLILALILATILNQKELLFKSFFRTSIFLPSITSLVAYSVLFKMMFSYDGIINRVLITLKILNEPYQWLGNAIWAKVIIIVALTWRWTGYNMMFYLSYLQNIPIETYEAAKIDGANAFQTFWKVTVPQLKPVILLTTIMSTNGTLQLFDEVMNITHGGPSNETLTMSQYIYNQAFVYAPDFGYASTLSYVIVGLMVILAVIQFRLAGDD